MMLALFKKIFSILIGDLPKDKQDEAWKKFTELLAILVEKGSEGVVRGAVK